MDRPEHSTSPLTGLAAANLPDYTLEEWQLVGKPAEAVLTVAGDAELDDQYGDLANVARIVIEFPVFMDGRGFSHARKLRELGFQGELIAAGEVLPDQWQFLQRCGFTGLKDHEVAETASALTRFSNAYQADALVAQPLFRRRAQG